MEKEKKEEKIDNIVLSGGVLYRIWCESIKAGLDLKDQKNKLSTRMKIATLEARNIRKS